MPSYLSASYFAAMVTVPAAGQPATSAIELLHAAPVSVDHADAPHVESHLAAHPRDAQHLLATAMVLIDGETRAFPHVSFDGGRTWRRGEIIDDSSIVAAGAGDPVVYLTARGSAFFSTLSKVDGVDRGLIARSADGGRTWRTTAVLPYTDRQWLAFAPDRGPFAGRVYFTGTAVYQSRDGARAVAPYLARSDDDGHTFPQRTIVAYDRGGADPGKPLDAVPLEPLVTARGLLVLTLQGGVDADTMERARRDALNVWSIGLMVSDDGGDSFGAVRYAPVLRQSLTGDARRRLRAHSATGYVRTAIDVSRGAYRDRVYFVAADYDAAADRYVARVWYTADFGRTWGTVVASDAPSGDVANPAIAVNDDGIVAVTWNDRRDDPEARCWRLYAAVSVDGGASFLPAQRLSDAPTCTNAPRNWDTFGASFHSDHTGAYLAHFQSTALVPTRYPMGGDTQGLVADAAGVFHAAHIDGRTGVLQLWQTAFAVGLTLVEAVRRRDPPESAAAANASPSGMEDVTREVGFHVVDTDLAFDSRRYRVRVALENRSGRPMRGPLRAVMRHFLDEVDKGLGLKNLAVANADSGGAGVGATWDFEVPEGVLAPGARTAPRVIEFSFEGGVPEFPEGYLSPGFVVFARGR